MTTTRRNSLSKFGATAAIICFCIFVLAGCGGSGYSSSSSTKPPPPTTQTPPPPVALTVAVSPTAQSLAAGASIALAVNILGGSSSVTLGLTGSTLLATSPGPGNISWTYAPASVTTDGSSLLTLNVGANVPAGSYNLTLTASAGATQATTPLTLTVTAVSSAFTLAVSPTTQSVAASASTTLAVSTTGASGNVTLGLTGSALLAQGSGSAAINWSYAPASIAGQGSSTLTLNVGTNVPAGTYYLTLTANAGSTQVTTPLTLTVASPPVGGHPLWSADFSTITPGNIVGDYGSGTPPDSQTMKDLEARGWSGEGNCPTQYGYCPGAIVVMPGPTGTPVHALRYRYEEGPGTDSNGTGLEVKLALETAFFPGNPLAVNGGLKEVYVRYYLQTQPVPANTPACTPNCPTTSTVNNVATKQHYWKSIGESGGPSWGSFVVGFPFGSTQLATTYQEATDCPFDGGVFNCPNIYQNVNQVPIADNQWYCVEYHWKDNTVSPQVLANGDFEMWINGTQVIESASRQWDDATHQTALDYFMIYRQSGGFQWRFETDLAIDTQPIPCLDGWTPPSPSPPQAGTMGENTLGTTADSGKVGLLSAQKVELTTAGTLQSLSFYVASGAAGSMHLAVYNDLGGDTNGFSGQPGVLLAKTNDFTVVNGWNTQPVTTPVTLQPGTYWLAFEYTDPGVQFLNFGNGASLGASHTWGALPAQWGELYSNLSGTSQWSFYATLTGN